MSKEVLGALLRQYGQVLELASGSSHPRGLRVSAKVFFFSATEMVMVSHLHLTPTSDESHVATSKKQYMYIDKSRYIIVHFRHLRSEIGSLSTNSRLMLT